MEWPATRYRRVALELLHQGGALTRAVTRPSDPVGLPDDAADLFDIVTV